MISTLSTGGEKEISWHHKGHIINFFITKGRYPVRVYSVGLSSIKLLHAPSPKTRATRAYTCARRPCFVASILKKGFHSF
jgi:hypothetical protein